MRQPLDVEQRLRELSLTKEGLLRVVAIAIGEAANATPFHCANSAGTFAYHHGTWALRDQFVGEEWKVDRVNGIESIRHRNGETRIAFQNVDMACSDVHEPKPRSEKGSGSERVCHGNLFGDLPRYVPEGVIAGQTYYLMVDQKGAAELTMPIVKDKTFIATVERIYLSDGSDLINESLLLHKDDVVDDFDPLIARK